MRFATEVVAAAGCSVGCSAVVGPSRIVAMKMEYSRFSGEQGYIATV